MSPRRERNDAQKLLARSRHGVNEELLIHGHGLRWPTIIGLVRAGLAAVDREMMLAAGKTIEVVRIRITEAGRKAIEE